MEIGEPRKTIIVEPMPEVLPISEPDPMTPEKEPEKVPA